MLKYNIMKTRWFMKSPDGKELLYTWFCKLIETAVLMNSCQKRAGLLAISLRHPSENYLSICLKTEKNRRTLCRYGRSQDLSL
jgi:hypothetical protein